jgi:hypothetical protein
MDTIYQIIQDENAKKYARKYCFKEQADQPLLSRHEIDYLYEDYISTNNISTDRGEHMTLNDPKLFGFYKTTYAR